MGYRYSREEIGQVERLVSQGLTSREIGKRLNRSEAGIRNIRYRMTLRTKTEDHIKYLHEQKIDLESKIKELDQTLARQSDSIRSLEEKKKYYDSILHSEEESMKKLIEDRLIALKLEKPGLFYITEAEQIAKLGVTIVSWLFSRAR